MESITVDRDGNGGVIIGAKEAFERNEVLNLAETNQDLIDSAIIDVYLGKIESQPGGPVYKIIPDGVGFNLQLISDVHLDEHGKIKDPEAALRVAEGTLTELRRWYDVDDKYDVQEDDGSIVWQSVIQRGDRKVKLSVIERRLQPEEGNPEELPISATAHIQKPSKPYRRSRKPHTQHTERISTAARIWRVIKGRFE